MALHLQPEGRLRGRRRFPDLYGPDPVCATAERHPHARRHDVRRCAPVLESADRTAVHGGRWHQQRVRARSAGLRVVLAQRLRCVELRPTGPFLLYRGKHQVLTVAKATLLKHYGPPRAARFFLALKRWLAGSISRSPADARAQPAAGDRTPDVAKSTNAQLTAQPTRGYG